MLRSEPLHAIFFQGENAAVYGRREADNTYTNHRRLQAEYPTTTNFYYNWMCKNQHGQIKYNLETGSHTVYALQYHFVTVTKYRADLLTDEIAERVGEIASDVSEDFGVNTQNVNGGSDHVHILFTAKPTTDLTNFINSLKGVTSRKIRDENPEVRQALNKAF